MILKKIQGGQEWRKGPCSAVMCPGEVRAGVCGDLCAEWVTSDSDARPPQRPLCLWGAWKPIQHWRNSWGVTRTSPGLACHPLSDCLGWAVSPSHPRWRPTPLPWQVNFLPLSGAAAALLTCRWRPGMNWSVGISFPCLVCGLWGGSGPPGWGMRGAMGLGSGQGGGGWGTQMIISWYQCR